MAVTADSLRARLVNLKRQEADALAQANAAAGAVMLIETLLREIEAEVPPAGPASADPPMEG